MSICGYVDLERFITAPRQPAAYIKKQLPEALQIPLHRPRAFREKKEKQKLVSLDPLELNEEAEEIALLFRV